MDQISLDELRALATERTATIAPGDSLDIVERSLIELGVAVSVTALDRRSIERAIAAAFAAGANATQVQEIVSLVSGLGVHSLMTSAVAIVAAATEGGQDFTQPLDQAQQRLWDRHVGEDPYWATFDQAAPG